jgi:hypothetical protein
MKSILFIFNLYRIVVWMGIISLASCGGTKVKEEAVTTTAEPLPDSIPPPTPTYDSTRPADNENSTNLVSQGKSGEEKPVKKAKLSYDDYRIEIKTIREEGLGWGYDICLENETPHFASQHQH